MEIPFVAWRVGAVRRIREIVVLLVPVLALSMLSAAQDDPGSQSLDLGIIVMPTLEGAQGIVKELNTGNDFSVLAKEKSIDATATDGGYMGKLDPAQLRVELRNAIRGHGVGQLTDIVRLPSGFAVVKIFASPPARSDLSPKRISSLVETGAIRIGPLVSGVTEANLAFQAYAQRNGWDPHDLRRTCEIRTNSLADAKESVKDTLAQLGEGGAQVSLPDQIAGHSALAQLYGYSGEMQESIAEWKIAYDLATTGDPGALPNLEESIGTAYLHLSEMENDIYRGSTDLDIFPPLHPHTSFQNQDASKQAIEHFKKYLEHRPDDLEVRWLLNLAYMTLGQYPADVPPAFLIPEINFESKERLGRFMDVATSSGLNAIRSAGGVIVDDFDGDGLLDVLASSMDVCDPIRLFHNKGDGTFTDVSKEAGLQDQFGGLNIVQGDYNNNGCMDFVILRGGWEFAQRKSLMRNNCDGTFTDVTDQSGLGTTVTSTQAAAWADVDNDGYLDLFVANENSPEQLFHNKRDGTFEEIGAASGVGQTGFSKGVAAADFDRDGFTDFYVTNQNGSNFLYHNNGNRTFTEVGRQAGVQAPSYGFATWSFDYDNDGWPDLFAASYLISVEESVKTYVGGPQNAETLKLYRNRQDGTFEDVTQKVGLNKVFMVMGANFGDIDNDGYLDFYLGAGQPSYTSVLPHMLFRNEDGRSFVDVTESSGTGELHKGHGIAFADLSRRGSEDIVSGNGGAVPGDKHALRVFKNPGNANNWLNLHLVGVRSNRAAFGAQIHLTVKTGKSEPRSIYRTVGQTSSFGGNPIEQLIGLGRDAYTVTLDIRWPTSKSRQHFANVAPNQYIEVKEFASGYTRLERHPFPLGTSDSSRSASASRQSK
jgi:tetratricopeptide (TPR) repeat protein